MSTELSGINRACGTLARCLGYIEKKQERQRNRCVIKKKKRDAKGEFQNAKRRNIASQSGCPQEKGLDKKGNQNAKPHRAAPVTAPAPSARLEAHLFIAVRVLIRFRHNGNYMRVGATNGRCPRTTHTRNSTTWPPTQLQRKVVPGIRRTTKTGRIASTFCVRPGPSSFYHRD